MEWDELIVSEWRRAASGRRARCYRLRPAGRKRPEAKERRWRRMVDAIALVLNPSEKAR